MLKKVRKWTKFIGQTKGPVIIYVEGGGKKKKEWRGGQGYFRLTWVGGSLNFYQEV